MTDSGSMTNPSEAIIEAVALAICEADCGRITENELARCRELAQAAISAMRAICKSCVQEFDIVTGHACSGLAATPAAPVCPSCGGLNISCPDGCGRDPKTGELNGTRLEQAATPAAPVQDVERQEPWRTLRMYSSSALGELKPHELEEWAGASRQAIEQARLTPDRPVQDDDPMVRDVEEWLRTHPPDRAEVRQRAFQDASMPEDRVTPLVGALREARDELALTQGAHGHIVAKLDAALRDGGFDA